MANGFFKVANELMSKATIVLKDVDLKGDGNLVTLGPLGPIGIAVYNSLAYHADREGRSWPSYHFVAREISASRTSVIEAIKLLDLLGLIVIIKRRNTSNIYSLTMATATGSSPPAPPGTPGVPPSPLGVPPLVRQADPAGTPGGPKPDPINQTHLNQTHLNQKRHAADKPPRDVEQASLGNAKRSATFRAPSDNRISDTGPDTPDTSLPGKAPRKRDELFDAVAEVTGTDPDTSGSYIGRVCKNLRKASPPYTPEEVRAWAVQVHGQGWLNGFPSLGHLEKTIRHVRQEPPQRSTSRVRAPKDKYEGYGTVVGRADGKRSFRVTE